jgi:chromosome segregation ATPase
LRSAGPAAPAPLPAPSKIAPEEEMASESDSALIAAQLAVLTSQVAELSRQLETLLERSDDADARADTQQERIDLAARELGEVSARLQAAANALRESI